MIYFQVNEMCNGCLACVQNCPARALESREKDGIQMLLHNMARCARCATCWRVCPQDAIEFQHMLQNHWDEVVAHELVRCAECGEIIHTVRLAEGLETKVRGLADPLCPRHRLERQAGIQTGMKRPARGVVP